MRDFAAIEANISQAAESNDSDALILLAEEAEAVGSLRAMASAARARAISALIAGNPTEAIGHLGRAMLIFEQLNDSDGIARIQMNIGLVFESSGNYIEAIDYIHRSYEYFIRQDNVLSASSALGNMGTLYMRIGDYAESLRCLHDVLQTSIASNVPNSIAKAYHNIASVYDAQRDEERALEYFDKARIAYSDAGQRSNVAMALGNMAAICIRAGRIDEARAIIDEQASIPSRDPRIMGLDARNRASVAEYDGNVDLAKQLLERALELASDAGSRSGESTCHRLLRDAAKRHGDFAAYVYHNEEHLRIRDELHSGEARRRLAMLQAQQHIEAERAETQRHRALLYNTLPSSVADRILRGEVVTDTIDLAAVVFVDLVGFTTMSSAMLPNDVVALLSTIFTTIDDVVTTNHLVKIKTIGDAYMAVCFEGDAVQHTARAALHALRRLAHEVPDIRIRIGIHCGPVTAGVIGTERLQYDVWGDTVNVASRMESTGEPGRIHVSEAFATVLGTGVTPRGEIEIKGKGLMKTYWLESTP